MGSFLRSLGYLFPPAIALALDAWFLVDTGWRGSIDLRFGLVIGLFAGLAAFPGYSIAAIRGRHRLGAMGGRTRIWVRGSLVCGIGVSALGTVLGLPLLIPGITSAVSLALCMRLLTGMRRQQSNRDGVYVNSP